MWVCKTHMKEVLPLLDAPHASKASYQIKCSLCENFAIAKVYYNYQTYHFSKQSMYFLSKTSSRKSG
ncbi:hypothetical protein HFZ78_14385 [Priestia megaterium]|uniref:Uncharacterized protein n=1 Tax=Priestia megaterium TaxID=1404 RepID=A0A6H1P2S7_PRIMG|nr:hypothetical protein [Priestia megaterium]QIZ07765.1 hypothetical protein HFZ78_14385 [Priestia megaterium]